jgi:hypothetical protein
VRKTMNVDAVMSTPSTSRSEKVRLNMVTGRVGLAEHVEEAPGSQQRQERGHLEWVR